MDAAVVKSVVGKMAACPATGSVGVLLQPREAPGGFARVATEVTPAACCPSLPSLHVSTAGSPHPRGPGPHPGGRTCCHPNPDRRGSTAKAEEQGGGHRGLRLKVGRGLRLDKIRTPAQLTIAGGSSSSSATTGCIGVCRGAQCHGGGSLPPECRLKYHDSRKCSNLMGNPYGA